MTGTLLISQVARAAGVAPSAVRYYERLGLVQPAARVNGRRVYRPSTVVRLGAIRLCQDAGFTLREIACLVEARRQGRRGWEPMARRKIVELEAQIEALECSKSLLEHALACDSPELEACPHFQAEITCRVTSLAHG